MSSKPGPSRLPPPLPPRQNSTACTPSTSSLSSSTYLEAPPAYEDSITLVDNSPYEPPTGEASHFEEPRKASEPVDTSSHTPWTAQDHQRSNAPWTTQDPRTSSTQSLVPSGSNQQHERRLLLLVYIHGFMGNETSFRSFPAHVHNLLTVLLAETHVVHTKVYPRYRSKRNISFARDDFSAWLEPHEDEKTDVVLLGHSMGGLLCAEVVLMPPGPIANRPLKHRILGAINFDVPFLGMHPGVVKSGLASIFNAAEEPGDKFSPVSPDGASSIGSPISPISSMGHSDTLWGQQDPNFNPQFNNDVVLPIRKGWQNAWHFLNKHSGELMKSTKQLVTSHLEFGGAMANYPELKARYGRVRALEEENGDVRKSVIRSDGTPARVRFVNYYTASTGRIKKPKSPIRRLSQGKNKSQSSLSPASAIEESSRGRLPHDNGEGHLQTSRSQSPRISSEEHSDDGVIQKVPQIPESEDEDWAEAAETLTIGDAVEGAPVSSNENIPEGGGEMLSPTSTLSTIATLPPVPDPPAAPPPLDLSFIQDPATRKLVEKEHKRAMKSYEKAVKDREKAIRDRAKLEEKRERKVLKEAEKTAKDAEKAKQKAERDADKAKKTQKIAEVEEAKQPEKEMTQAQGEELRLQKEKQRMEAEARRMRGEKTPEDLEAPDPPEAHADEIDMPSGPIHESEIVRADTMPALQQISSQSASEASRSPSPQPVPSEEKPKKPLKDRKFCTLPPKDANGQLDPCWVRVFMENVDEVGAHCGLFFVDQRYERLVGDVADRIEGWVKEDESQRAAEQEYWAPD